MAAVVFSVSVLIGISVQSIYDSLNPYQQKRIATFLDPVPERAGCLWPQRHTPFFAAFAWFLRVPSAQPPVAPGVDQNPLVAH